MYSSMNKETYGKHATYLNPIISKYYLQLCQAYQYKQAFFKKLYFTIHAYWLKSPDSWQQVMEHLEKYVMTQRMIELYGLVKPKNK